ncbi:unnamed protein product [Thlaspi arvense]|uniref:Cystatin domain-containing protein n=1 Tax=Thlaspi arvense TaxID=13288 RepID=A0AAU9T8S9_THLAR|nr:unnamed protein product [Thlaspi arvense]
MMKLLIFLTLILVPLITTAQAREPAGPWKRIRTVSLSWWEKMGMFAVNEHNKNTRANLEFVRNLEGKEQYDTGARDVLILEAKDRSGRIVKYEATVFETMPDGHFFWKLESFRPI